MNRPTIHGEPPPASEGTDDDLRSRGFDDAWWRRAPPPLRRTVLVLRARLRTLGLWRFVAAEVDSEVGALDVRCRDLGEFARRLQALGFTRPRSGPNRRGLAARWDSAERVAVAAVHVKHFDGWDPDRVQFHVDPVGLHVPWRWWLVPPVPLLVAVWHASDPRGYRDIDRVERLLRACGRIPD